MSSKYKRGRCSRQDESVDLPDEETLQHSGDNQSELEDEEDIEPVILKNGRIEDCYVVGAVLGKGRFGIVYQCTCKQTERQFAGKFIRKVGLRLVSQEDIRREVDIMNAIHSRHVVSLRDGFETPEFVVLMLDLATGGELFDYLAEKDTLTEDQASKFTRQILEGIDCMHEKNIVHLDLKPENVMLKDNNGSEVVIIDLGLARDLSKGEVKDICGTPEFIAPEILNFDPINLATDLWAIGVIVYIMLSGYSPFLGDDDNETMVNVSNGNYEFYDEFFNEVSTGAKDFIKKLLRIRPKDRSSAAESLVHPWIRPRRGQRSRSRINTARLKRFNARQKWQATMEAVRVSLRMRISIGGANSWIKSQPSGSTLSVDSLSSLNDDCLSIGGKREKSVPSSEYSDNVFTSPVRQSSQQTLTENMRKWSLSGSMSSFNDTDDEAESTYSKSSTMAKVHQVIESRNLKRSLSPGEQQPMTAEEAGSLPPGSSSKRQRKAGLSTQLMPSGVLPLSVSEERSDDDDGKMSDGLVSSVAASRREQLEAKQRECEKWETKRDRKLDSPLGLNSQGKYGSLCSSHDQQRDFRNSPSDAGSDEPICDEKMKTEESGGKSVSRAQKLRHSIMNKLRRVSSSVEEDKASGASKNVEAESKLKLEMEKGPLLAEGSVGKKKKQKKVIRVVKRVVRRKVAKEASPKEASPETGLSPSVYSSDAQVEEKPKAATPRDGLSRLIRRFSFGRGSRSSKPGVAEKHIVPDDEACQVNDESERQRDGSGVAETENENLATDIINQELLKTPIDPETMPNSELARDRPQPILHDMAVDGKELDISVVAAAESVLHQPQSGDTTHGYLFGEKTRIEEFSCEVEEASMKHQESENQRHCIDHVNAEMKLTCKLNDHDCGTTRSSISVNSQPLQSGTGSLARLRTEEFPLKPSNSRYERKRLGHWQAEKVVSVRERVQMYQGQKGTTKVDVGKSIDSGKRPVPRERSDSVSSLREKFEKSGMSAAGNFASCGGGVKTLKETAAEPSPPLKQKTVSKPPIEEKKLQRAGNQTEVSSGISHCQQAESGQETNAGKEMAPKVKMNSVGEAAEARLGTISTSTSVNSKCNVERQNHPSLGVQKQYPIHQPYLGMETEHSSGGLSHCRVGNSASKTTYSNDKHRDVASSVIGDHQSDGRLEIASVLKTTPEPDEVNRVRKLRQLWRSRESSSEESVDGVKSRGCTPPPKAHFRDSWQKVEMSTRRKSDSKSASGVCGSALLLKKGPPTVSQCQGWYKKKQPEKAPGESANTTQSRSRGASLHVMSDRKSSETVEINSSDVIIATDISGSSDTVEETAGFVVGTRAELAKRAKNEQSAVVCSGTSVRHVENGMKHFPQIHQSTFSETVHPTSVSQNMLKGTGVVPSKPIGKVSSGAVPAHFVQPQTRCEPSHKGAYLNGLANFRSELGRPANDSKKVSAPHISLIKQSTLNGKSGTKVMMSFSVQKP